MITRPYRVLSAVFIALLPVGCGGVGNVSGEVTFKGQPVPLGQLSMFCQDGKKPVFTVPIHNGHYSISGVPVGEVRIAIETFSTDVETSKTPLKNRPFFNPRNLSKEEIEEGLKYNLRIASGPKLVLPPRYQDADQSGLTYRVTRGNQEHHIPLEP